MPKYVAAAAANAGFANVPAATASLAIEVIVIDDDVPDGNAVAPQECKMEPNDVSEIKTVNPAQEEDDVADYDVGNI